MKNNLNENLKHFRIQNGLKQREIADILKIPQRTYSNYETGAREPNVDMLIDLAEFYKMPIDILVGRYKLNNDNYKN